MPPLVLSEEDVDWFADALDAVVARAQRMPSAMTRFALKAARAGRGRVREAARPLGACALRVRGTASGLVGGNELDHLGVARVDAASRPAARPA